jgi:hypothetical protein
MIDLKQVGECVFEQKNGKIANLRVLFVMNIDMWIIPK